MNRIVLIGNGFDLRINNLETPEYININTYGYRDITS